MMAATALILIALAGGWIVFSAVSDPYRTVARLDVHAYLENANGLRGNTYKIRGTIDTQLAWNDGGQRLYAVTVDSELLPVLVPPDFRNVNVQKGQEFSFRVEVREGGILEARDLTKA